MRYCWAACGKARNQAGGEAMRDSYRTARPLFSANAADTEEGTPVSWVWMLAGMVISASIEDISDRIEALLFQS